MDQSPRFWVIIPAAGRGLRMRESIPKQYLTVRGRTVIEHVLERFLTCEFIQGITVAVSADDPYWPRYVRSSKRKPVLIVEGGRERLHSVRNGLAALDTAEDADWVLVHDAARPCLSRRDLEQLIQTLKTDTVGGILAIPLTDTVKRVDQDGAVQETLQRTSLWRALTPQMFRYGLLCDALDNAIRKGAEATDEAAAMEAMGHIVRVVEGRSDNIKITMPGDVELAEAMLALRGGQ